jgi:predicted transcriptional regulator
MMAEQESIGPDDMKLLFVTDSTEELVKHIKRHSITEFGLKKEQYKAKWWLGESKR